MRTHLPLLALLAATGACEVGQGALGDLATNADGGSYGVTTLPKGATLRTEDIETPLELIYGEGKPLTVVLEDADGVPIPSAPIRFALDDEAGGSSLRDLSVQTDQDGRAATLLTAGSLDSDFAVRAAAAGLSLFIPVKVRMLPLTEVTVSLAYEGARAIDHYLLETYANTTCDAFLDGIAPAAPNTETTVAGSAASAVVAVPDIDDPVVLRVTALGPRANVAAVYCGLLDSAPGDEATTRVSLTDSSLRLGGSYPLTLQLDVDASAARLGQALEDSLAITAADADSPNALRMLNAVQDTLMAANATDDANWVAGQRPSLAPALEQALGDADTGLTLSVLSLADMVRERGAHLTFAATLSASGNPTGELSLSISGVSARDGAGGFLPLRFGGAYDLPSVSATLSAEFDTTMSALQIDALRIELGLASYGDSLLHALADAPEGLAREALLETAGCTAFTAWAQGQSELYDRCDDSCLQTACERALDDMLDDTRMQLEPLDGPHAGIALRGNLPIYDVTGDGIARDVDAAPLTGSWGRAAGAIDPDTVTGEVDGRAP